MSTNYVFSNNTDFTAKYISRPGTGGYGGIITFSPSKDGSSGTGTLKEVDRAMLINSVSINFGRTVSQQYFLNVDGTSYQIGRGTGTMTVQGMLGSAQDFAAMFGTNYTDPCKNIFTVKLDAFGMTSCDSGEQPGVIIMTGVIAQSININTTVMNETGAIYYTAGATFLIAGLGVDDMTASPVNAQSFLSNRQSL